MTRSNFGVILLIIISPLLTQIPRYDTNRKTLLLPGSTNQPSHKAKYDVLIEATVAMRDGARCFEVEDPAVPALAQITRVAVYVTAHVIIRRRI